MTNGEKIREAFPNARIEYHKATDLVDEHVTVFINGCDTCQDYSMEWWNAEYREPITKNDLGVDCISRADAIQAMQDKAKKLTNEDTINGLCGAVAILFDLPSVTPQEPKTGWIPVSERLPKAYEFVNCTCHSLIDDREDWVVETCYIPQPHNSPYSDWGNIPMLNSCECEVIAWMHRDIPKPYKTESEKA